MKLVCVKLEYKGWGDGEISKNNNLTIGKIYESQTKLFNPSSHVYVEGDDGFYGPFLSSHFVTLKEYRECKMKEILEKIV